MRFDVLFTNSRIVDGTGAPWYRGYVGVSDGVITHVDRGRATEHTANDVIDVNGDVVAPGFIDTHSHSDLELFDTPLLPPKTRQGVTTEILGQDGFSVAPIYDNREAWAKRLSTLDGRTSEPWEWGGMAEYLAAIESAETAQNFGTLVGHGTVRFNAMGMRDDSPTEDDLERMSDLIADSLDAGALGFSTGLIYPPQSHASTAELLALAETLHDYGRPFVAHIRSEGRWIWEALDEFADIGGEASVPIHLSHYKLSGPSQQGKADRSNDFIESIRERGIDMTAEQYPYTAGHTSLSAVLPPWVQTKDADDMLSALDDPEARERMKADVTEWRISGWENVGALAGWENIEVTNIESGATRQFEGMSVEAIAEARDVHPVDAVCALLLEEELEVNIIVHSMSEADVRRILQNERVGVASDGIFGDRPHPRLYGTFPRVLGTYVRDENLLTLEAAVRKMTSLPARVMGLQGKGLVRAGMDADLVVFDDRTVESKATFDAPTRDPIGIKHVYVNGEAVIRDGEFTGQTPGGVIRA